MTVTASELGHRLQLVQASQWLYAAYGEPYDATEGDPYAKVLRGFDEDPYPLYAKIRERGPLWQSRIGAWVCGHHEVAVELLNHEGLDVRPTDATPGALRVVELLDTPLATERAGLDRLRALMPTVQPEVILRAVSTVDGDLADLANRVAVQAAAESLESPRFSHYCADLAIAVDGTLTPQRLVPTMRMLDSLNSLREDGEAALLLALAGVRVAADLTANTLIAALADWSRLAGSPDLAGKFVEETLRFDPPVQLQALIAQQDLELAGQSVAAGSQVVIAIGAANRDPAVFDRPDVFDPGRQGQAPVTPGWAYGVVLDFARVVAEATVRGLAERFPGLRPDGPVLRRNRAAITRSPLRIPARTR